MAYFTKPENDRIGSLKTTLGVRPDISTRFMTAQSARLKIELWDTAGQEQFRSIVRSHYRGADGVLLVYNITDKLSFLACGKWLEDLRAKIDEDVPIMLVGNQIDLSDLRKVETSEGEAFALQNGLLFTEISATKGTGVEDAFQTLVEGKGTQVLTPLSHITDRSTYS
ncbi:Ras- protein Rab-2A [Ceratobasidium sp. 423]|nr:Ras- protein Rab-2A [Ceratobasidium sp. 423]